MSKTQGFFSEYLPNKISNKPDLVDEMGAVIVFDIDGAGGWTVNLKDAPGAVTEGLTPGADCTCLLYTSPSPRDATLSRMPSSA